MATNSNGMYPDELIISDLRANPLRSRLPYEIHYRMPRKLPAPFMASHFVQLRQSVEEKNFSDATEKVLIVFGLGTADFQERHPDLRPACDLKTFWRGLGVPEGNMVTFGRNPRALSDEQRVSVNICQEYYRLLQRTPAIFVFGTADGIVEWITRRVTDICGSDELVDKKIQAFAEAFRPVFNKAMRKLTRRDGEVDGQGRVLSTSEFGGVRSWLETNPSPRWPNVVRQPHIVPVDAFGARFDDFKHYRASATFPGGKLGDVLSLQVRWNRHPHSWTYTLIESPAEDLANRANHAACTPLSPARLTDFLLTAILSPNVAASHLLPKLPSNRKLAGHVLAGAHYLLVRIEDLMAFSCADPTALDLATAGLSPGSFNSQEIRRRIRRFHRDSGSSTLIESNLQRPSWNSEDPAWLAYEAPAAPDENLEDKLEAQAERVAASLRDDRNVRRAHVIAVLDACLAALGGRATYELLSTLGDGVQQILPSAVGAVRRQWSGLHRKPPSMARTPETIKTRLDTWDQAGMPPLPADLSAGEQLLLHLESIGIMTKESRLVLGDIVRAAIAAPAVTDAEKSEILRLNADLTRVFWHATFRHTIDRSALQVGDDFVGSAMADGRCIYFSNFMPFGDERFTRTIFVDIDLGHYQRARVLQRLSDILTYRSVPLHDLNQVTTAIDALIDMNRLLNNVQVKLTTLGNTQTSTPNQSDQERLNTSRSQANDLQEQLRELLHVSVMAGRLNDYFTYGIAGKAASAQAYYDQIVERTQDIREERILGYALLSDFLTRRLKHSIRFIERMDMHHRTVNQRTGELLDRVRTELDALRALQLVDGLKQQIGLVDQQVRLTRVAEILVVFGGAYYTLQLLKPVIKLFETVVARTMQWIVNMLWSLATQGVLFLQWLFPASSGWREFEMVAVALEWMSLALHAVRHTLPETSVITALAIDAKDSVIAGLLVVLFLRYTHMAKDVNVLRLPAWMARWIFRGLPHAGT